jgi:pimeloyl-ACP methyl ester carboxylesterase
VVLPSIPGYGFSEAPGRPGYTIRDVGLHISDLMVELGYDRFAAQGGDWGAMATEHMALATPERLIGIHLNLLMAYPPSTPGALDGISERVRLGLERMAQFEASGGSLYWRIHGTTPTTLTPALSDSPAGLASWIVEKFNWWTDNQSNLLDVISRDDLLTHLTIYWVTNTIGSSIDLYYETVQHAMPGGPHEKVEVPTAALVLPKELVTPDRRWIDPLFNIVRWTEHDSGGHFAAMELPELFVEDVRAAFRPYR